MSTWEPSRRALAERIIRELDPRLQPDLMAELDRELSAKRAPIDRIVLAGHRAAGKTRILPLVAELLNRAGRDLDHELARQRDLRSWLTEDPVTFRRAERDVFSQLPSHEVIAVGGGFLSLHADLLVDRSVVLVPVSFPTYRERLLADTARPRLRPELSLEEEVSAIWTAREALHTNVRTIPLPAFLASAIAEG